MYSIIHEIINLPFWYLVIKRKRAGPLYTCGKSISYFCKCKASLLLIGEAKVDSERRVDKALELAFGLEAIAVLAKGSHILSVQVDQVGAVGLDAGRGDGLGQD
jgi:hypothetical protein